MTEHQQEGPNLEQYSGSGEDLTQEQREYLNTYAQHEVGQGDTQASVSGSSLPEDAEGEWA
jgi:hypothetical protein